MEKLEFKFDTQLLIAGENLDEDEIHDYIIDNFTYSILEIFDMKTKREGIIHREEYWKKVFQTVKFGMNNVHSIKSE